MALNELLRALDLIDPGRILDGQEIRALVPPEAVQNLAIPSAYLGGRAYAMKSPLYIRAEYVRVLLAQWPRKVGKFNEEMAIAQVNDFFGTVQITARQIAETLVLPPPKRAPSNFPDETATPQSAAPYPVEVQTFESPFGKARVVIFSDGTPWFVAKDVCEGLGLGGTLRDHVKRMNDLQKQVLNKSRVSNPALIQELFPSTTPALYPITRGGYNDLILESRKPLAREYRQWVTDEVLPALQDTGTYTDKNHAMQQQEEQATGQTLGRIVSQAEDTEDCPLPAISHLSDAFSVLIANTEERIERMKEAVRREEDFLGRRQRPISRASRIPEAIPRGSRKGQ